MTERTWGEARSDLTDLLQTLRLALPRNRVNDGRFEYNPSHVLPLLDSIDAAVEDLRPRRTRQGKRIFGRLSSDEAAIAVRKHLDGWNDAQIALYLRTSGGQVSYALRRFITGVEEPYWPDDNPEGLTYCGLHDHDHPVKPKATTS